MVLNEDEKQPALNVDEEQEFLDEPENQRNYNMQDQATPDVTEQLDSTLKRHIEEEISGMPSAQRSRLGLDDSGIPQIPVNNKPPAPSFIQPLPQQLHYSQQQFMPPHPASLHNSSQILPPQPSMHNQSSFFQPEFPNPNFQPSNTIPPPQPQSVFDIFQSQSRNIFQSQHNPDLIGNGIEQTYANVDLAPDSLCLQTETIQVDCEDSSSSVFTHNDGRSQEIEQQHMDEGSFSCKTDIKTEPEVDQNSTYTIPASDFVTVEIKTIKEENEVSPNSTFDYLYRKTDEIDRDKDDVTMKQFRILTARRPFHSLSAQMSRLSSKVIVPMYHYQHTHEMISEQCCENDTTPESLVPPSHGQEDEYVFSDPYHSMQVLTGLNSLRQSASFCDITLCVDGEEFKCHKIVLAAFSPYFKAMFGGDLAESQQDRVSLNGIESPMMELLIGFAYTSEIVINKSNVQALLSAANLLEVLSVRDACCDFLEKHMDVINCVGIHCFAESHACYDLQHKAKSFILRYFSDVVHQEEFGTLLHHKLAEFVSDDTLTVYREEDVFEAVVYWLKYDPENRKEVFYLVLEHVRLPLISPYYLLDCVEQADCVKNCFKCMELVEEAKKYHLLPDRKSEFMSIRTRPRKNAGTIEVLVAVGGEDDKVVLRSVECFDPRASSWKNLACLPFAISKHGLVVSGNNMIYLAGGEFPDGSESKAMWRYDPVFDAWQEMQSMNTTRSELGLAIVDGMIYAVGGWDGSCRLSSVEQYNPKTNMWMPVSQMKIAVTSPAVASYNGHLIVTGGGILEEGNSTNHVQSYDPKADVWTELTPMVMARSGSAACVLNHQIYVIGGWRQSVDNTNTVECYNPKTKIWKMVASLNCRRFRPGATVVDGKIYACGGEEGCDRYHETVECYDEKEDTWHIVSEMLSSRSWLGCAALRLHTDCLSQEKV